MGAREPGSRRLPAGVQGEAAARERWAGGLLEVPKVRHAKEEGISSGSSPGNGAPRPAHAGGATPVTAKRRAPGEAGPHREFRYPLGPKRRARL